MGKKGSVVAMGLSAQTFGFSAGFALRRHPKLTCSSSILLGMGNKSGLMLAVENEWVSKLIGSIWDMDMATGPLSWICVSESGLRLLSALCFSGELVYETGATCALFFAFFASGLSGKGNVRYRNHKH
jgi:hypothetical protein